MAEAEGRKRRRSWFTHWKYVEGKDSPSDARNVLLVVAALIAAVTFQTGVNPPGGVWQDDGDAPSPAPYPYDTNVPPLPPPYLHKAGRAVYASHRTEFTIFLAANTAALTCAVSVIMQLTYKFPFCPEIWTALVCMMATYVSAVLAVTPRPFVQLRYIFIAGVAPFLLRIMHYFID